MTSTQDAMIADDSTHDAPASSPREGLAEQLRHLEEFVTQATVQGEEMPPEAVEMIARLREIMAALDGLSASLGDDLSRVTTDAVKREQP